MVYLTFIYKNMCIPKHTAWYQPNINQQCFSYACEYAS